MKNPITSDQQKELLKILQARFEKNLHRHKKLKWEHIQAKLTDNPQKLWSLHQMEITGGEPDVVDYDHKTDSYTFYDCAPESPKDRRSLCYDRTAWDHRKQHKPKSSAMEVADQMGIDLLTEDQYRDLQQFGNFDSKTSSWLKTPSEIRKYGGAIFGDFRYGAVFIYHNGADSYYAARGFRGALKI